MSAKERRESVIRAAITEFELKGYYGTTTAARLASRSHERT